MSVQDAEETDVQLSRRASKRAKLDSDVQATEDAEDALNAHARLVEASLETRELAPEIFIKLTLSWAGQTFPVELGESDR